MEGLLQILFIGLMIFLNFSAKKDSQAKKSLARRQAALLQQQEAVPESIQAPETPEREQPHLAPSIAPSVHVSPHDHSGMYAGSMGDLDHEGFDPHDHGFSAEVDTPSMHSDRELNASFNMQEDEEEEAAPFLDWSGSSVARAFVMQEVLKRPAARR